MKIIRSALCISRLHKQIFKISKTFAHAPGVTSLCPSSSSKNILRLLTIDILGVELKEKFCFSHHRHLTVKPKQSFYALRILRSHADCLFDVIRSTTVGWKLPAIAHWYGGASWMLRSGWHLRESSGSWYPWAIYLYLPTHYCELYTFLCIPTYLMPGNY